MTTNSVGAFVRKSVTVNLSQERAFALFTEGMATWWPESHHIGDGVPEKMIVEPRAGGRIYDVYPGGVESAWASVREYDPPRRLVFAWQVGVIGDGDDWGVDPDLSHASTVDVRFIAESAARTRVELEHRDFDKHARGGEIVRVAVDSPNGWQTGLDAYARIANGG